MFSLTLNEMYVGLKKSRSSSELLASSNKENVRVSMSSQSSLHDSTASNDEPTDDDLLNTENLPILDMNELERLSQFTKGMFWHF
jgi:hypothetical protein